HLLTLHSFPTRRSSDLKYIVVAILLIKDNPHIAHLFSFLFTLEQCLSECHIIRGFIDKALSGGIYDKASGKRTFGKHNLHFIILDRKSTRLNSSHVSIS